MAPTSFEAAASRNAGSIRKGLEGLVAIAPYSAAIVTTLVATGGQISMPTGFKSVGWISDDGASESGDMDIAEIKAWGSAAPVRKDVTGATASLQVSLLEDNALSRSLYDSVDLTGAGGVVSAAGELKYDIDAQPDILYWRAIVLSVDGVGATRRYTATAYHKVSITAREDFVNANGDAAAARGVTLSAVPDDVTSTLGTKLLFGPGLLARAVAEGYTIAP